MRRGGKKNSMQKGKQTQSSCHRYKLVKLQNKPEIKLVLLVLGDCSHGSASVCVLVHMHVHVQGRTVHVCMNINLLGLL